MENMTSSIESALNPIPEILIENPSCSATAENLNRNFEQEQENSSFFESLESSILSELREERRNSTSNSTQGIPFNNQLMHQSLQNNFILDKANSLALDNQFALQCQALKIQNNQQQQYQQGQERQRSLVEHRQRSFSLQNNGLSFLVDASSAQSSNLLPSETSHTRSNSLHVSDPFMGTQLPVGPHDFLSSVYPQQQASSYPTISLSPSPYFLKESLLNKPINPAVNRRYSMHDHLFAMRRMERKHSVSSETFLGHNPNSHSYSSLPAYSHSPFAAQSHTTLDQSAPSSPFSMNRFSTTPLPSQFIYNGAADISSLSEHSAHISPDLLGIDTTAASSAGTDELFGIQDTHVNFNDTQLFPVAESKPAPAAKKTRGAIKRKRVYTCNIDDCRLEFNRLASLQEHALTHSEDYAIAKVKPFACPTCEQTFSRSHDLKRHMYMHNKVRPYVCDICSRGFSRRDALKRHENAVKMGKKVDCIPFAADVNDDGYDEIL